MAKRAGTRSPSKQSATSKKRGTVKGIREDWDNKKMARIDVEMPKKRGDKFAPETSVVVDKKFAKELSVGDKIKITTETTK